MSQRAKSRGCDDCHKDTPAGELGLVEANAYDRRGETYWACTSCYELIEAQSLTPNDPVTLDLLAEVLAKMYLRSVERCRFEAADEPSNTVE